MKSAGIIVAAGSSRRMGTAQPKQKRLLGGKPVYAWSVSVLSAHPEIQDVVLVVPKGAVAAYELTQFPELCIVEGGDSRTASVRAGLAALNAKDLEAVLIHDAARPGLTLETISSLIDALSTHDGAAPALKAADALKRQDGEHLQTVDRENLFRVQTPQAFRLPVILKALFANAESHVDDLAAVEALNGSIKLVDGSETLSKLTYPEDFTRMEKLLSPQLASVRMGTGFDVHAFGPGDHVMLCGQPIAHTHALMGHSDADVAWHALTDAILGAAALGDIGDHFPPSDPQWKGAASSVFLKAAQDLASAQGYQISNCDLTIICEAPKVKPHRAAMRQSTADLLGLSLNAVSVKATTTEKLGFTGRGEGIAAQASVTLSKFAS